MSVPAAYIGVILIWTTTPLAIKWSGEGSHFLFGITARMAIGAVLGLILLRLLRIPLPWHRKARRTYLASGLGIYGAMTCTYWGAQYIPSGWISVIFGLSPIMTGIMASIWLEERGLTWPKLGGMALGMFGLLIVFGKGMALGPQAASGIGALLLATLIHSSTAVWVKRIKAEIPAMATTAGGLVVAVFLLESTWILLGTQWPAQVTLRAGLSIVYLGVVGSILGFASYYYLLKRLEATKVALIPLITPVSALLLGNLANGEPITASVWLGTAAILSGLLCYEFGDRKEWIFRKVLGRV